MVSFAKVEQSQVEAVDVNALLAGLLKFRAPEWKAKGIEIRSLLSETRAEVMASPGQLEQVLLNLLVEGEKSASEAQEKTIIVSSSLLARRVLVEISYSTRTPESQRLEAVDHNHAGSEALGLGVCRGIIQGYGGDFREVRLSPAQVRFEVELPMTESMSAGIADVLGTTDVCRQLTVLIVEPDTKVQRQLVQLLGARGNRVVPVSSAEEGADVAERLRFDIVICALRLPGLNWVEFFERVRYRVGGFVLMTDGFDQALGMAFKNGEGFVLSKPIDETELLRVCRTIEERATVNN